VLSLEGTVLFADPLGGRDLPFTELVHLGGSGPMSGFHESRLIGRSAAALTLEYRYPIWAFLDSSLQLSVGNVFDAHLAGFSTGDLRLAFTAGIHTVGDGTQSFNLLFGGGTETFAQGGNLREVRVVLGLTQGF
jgi:outer membrane protein assembly factor BamA